MRLVGIDSFKEYRSVLSLRAGAGAVSFLEREADEENDGYRQRLWLWRQGRLATLTAWGVQQYWWQGSNIVFAALRTEEDKTAAQKGVPLTVLHTISTSSPGEAKELMRLPYKVDDLVFLPSGDPLFTAEHDPALHHVQRRRAGDGSQMQTLLEQQRDYEVLTELPYWKNGEGFSSGRRNRLYLWQNGAATALVDDKTTVEHLRLSPSGQYAYFIAKRWAGREPMQNRLMRLDTLTHKVEDISFARSFLHTAFALLADDELVVWGTDMKKYGMNQNGSFYRLHLPTRAATLLYSGGAYGEGSTVLTDIAQSSEPVLTAWQGGVCFSTTLGGDCHLMHLDTRSGAVAQLTTAPGAVLEYTVLDGSLYFTALRAQGGAELYHLTNGKEETRLTLFNSYLQKEYTLQKPEPLAFANKDGVTLQGWVLRPAGYTEGQLYPAILSIHGGPKAAYGAALNHEMQYLAARGYAVFFCNPTGSDGGGDQFADLRGAYGQADCADLLAFTDAVLAAHPWVDPARLGVMGGSYGGFMVNWLIGHTRRFAAAVSMRGISNWYTMSTTSDIGYFFVPDQTGADMWGDPGLLWDRSPLKYAPAVTTPTLFLHSEEDYRCWMAESLQMFAALQHFKVPSRLCLFKGENHDLSRSGKPSHRVRRLREIRDWFDEYLK